MDKKGTKPQICPYCKDKTTILEVIYGYPSPQLFRRAEKGQVMLGGCMVANTNWHCLKCKNYFE